ncbi:MAG: hypothetical protein Q8K59_12015 [Nitrosomonas sp.]|nr:hypothetical protein [Nitrosomonas sp.]
MKHLPIAPMGRQQASRKAAARKIWIFSVVIGLRPQGVRKKHDEVSKIDLFIFYISYNQ